MVCDEGCVTQTVCPQNTNNPSAAIRPGQSILKRSFYSQLHRLKLLEPSNVCVCVCDKEIEGMYNEKKRHNNSLTMDTAEREGKDGRGQRYDRDGG